MATHPKNSISTTKTVPSSSKQASSKSPRASSSPAVQFVHESCFAFVRAAKSKWTASDVINEALRVRGHCAHVAVPARPICHFGLDPRQLQSWLLELVERAQAEMISYSKGLRRQRSDTPIVLAAVISLPRSPADRDEPDCVAWREATLAWARSRYGDRNIVSILEHTDESFQHLHILAHSDGRTVKPMMAGHAAVQRAVADGAARNVLGKIYRAGCQALQDDYSQSVGRRFGLLRISDKPRPRKSRAAHLAALTREREEEVVAARDATTRAKTLASELQKEVERVIVEKRNLAIAMLRAQAKETVLAERTADVEDLLWRLSPEERQEFKARVANRRRP